jgi:hypothetical protein
MIKIIRGILLFPIITLVWIWDILVDLVLIAWGWFMLGVIQVEIYLIKHSRYMRERRMLAISRYGGSVPDRTKPARSFLLRN